MGDCNDFSKVVGSFVENMRQLKTLQKQAKELRAKQEELQQVIISYMETQALDVCRINKDGESGQLCVSESKSTKGVKRNSALSEITSFFEENRMDFHEGNVSTKADELWARVQQTREVKQKKKLQLR